MYKNKNHYFAIWSFYSNISVVNKNQSDNKAWPFLGILTMYLKFTLLHVWFSRIYGNEDVAKYILIGNLYKYTHAK